MRTSTILLEWLLKVSHVQRKIPAHHITIYYSDRQASPANIMSALL